MRTTLTLDDDVAEAAKSLSRATGKSLSAVVSELMRRGLLRGWRAGRVKSELPTFAVSKDSGVIPADRASRLLV